MISYSPDYQPSMPEESGWTGDASSFGSLKVRKTLRESIPVPPEPEPFDDTFQLTLARLREEERSTDDTPRFRRGVPTNNTTSSKNYPDHHVKIIKGEHVTLLKTGKICEAMDDDEHPSHILEHRMLLADPNLSEAQRGALMEHIVGHSKKHRKRLKAAKETAEAAGRYKKGFGRLARARDPFVDSKIPQDSKVDLERKRTAGIVSMEAQNRKQGQFRRSLHLRRGL